jgi:hypothetical protein
MENIFQKCVDKFIKSVSYIVHMYSSTVISNCFISSRCFQNYLLYGYYHCYFLFFCCQVFCNVDFCSLRHNVNLRQNLLPSGPFSALKKLGPNINGICVQGEHHLPTIKSLLISFTSSCQLVKSYIFICSGVRTTLGILLSNPPKVYCICNFPVLSLV